MFSHHHGHYYDQHEEYEGHHVHGGIEIRGANQSGTNGTRNEESSASVTAGIVLGSLFGFFMLSGMIWLCVIFLSPRPRVVVVEDEPIIVYE